MGVRTKVSKIVTVNDVQLAILPENGTINAVFILLRLQEEYNDTGNKLCVLLTYRKFLMVYQVEYW